jgi:hypothetical protein
MFRNLFKSKKELKRIGYWQSEREPFYPHPSCFQDPEWPEDERQKVVAYLKAGACLFSYRGRSWCRFNCSNGDMGSKDLTDGAYVWPEGLAHYVESHQVRLPGKFVEKCKKSTIVLDEARLQQLEEWPVSDKWWIRVGNAKK